MANKKISYSNYSDDPTKDESEVAAVKPVDSKIECASKNRTATYCPINREVVITQTLKNGDLLVVAISPCRSKDLAKTIALKW